MNSGLCLNSQDFVGLSRNRESVRPGEASKQVLGQSALHGETLSPIANKVTEKKGLVSFYFSVFW